MRLKDFVNEGKGMIRVGVVGYTIPKFDTSKAKTYLKDAFDKIEKQMPSKRLSIVSGLTDLGISSLAYKIAKQRKYHTVGIASKKAKEFTLFPVDKKYMIGDDWGDESNYFLNNIDILVKIGGGKQSEDEVRKARSKGLQVLEYKL